MLGEDSPKIYSPMGIWLQTKSTRTSMLLEMSQRFKFKFSLDIQYLKDKAKCLQ